MEIVVISDSHGNIANLKHVMGFAKKIKSGAIVHCGDWNTLESVETVLQCRIPVYGVVGNADINERIAESLKLKAKKFEEKFLKFEIDGKKIGVIHDIKKLETRDLDLDIIFFGHWQKQKDTFWNGIRAINPGALENNISFAIYDTDTNRVEFLSLKHE